MKHRIILLNLGCYSWVYISVVPISKPECGVMDVQVISIFGQPENCSNACKEILQVMQQESTNNNRGFVVTYLL
jgi:hypothetical protein